MTEPKLATGVLTVALVGNPNSGKTSLMNKLTGGHDSVGNYPRVTVSKRMREISHKGWTLRLVDLPGIYSLTSQSPEERIGRDFIQDERPDVVLNVLDAGNLERSLFLTTQLIEMGLPRIYVLNMADELHRKGGEIDLKAFGCLLDGPVVETVSTTGRGLPTLLDAMVATGERLRAGGPAAESCGPKIHYDAHLESAIDRVRKLVAELHPGGLEAEHDRWFAIKLLEGDDEMLRREDEHRYLIEMVRRERFDLAHTHGEEAEIMFADSRYGFIHGLLSQVRRMTDSPRKRLATTRAMDSVLLHHTLGFPIFLALIWIIFETTFTLGQLPADMIDAGVGWVSEVVGGMIPGGLVHDLVVNGVIAGVGGTIVFLPNILILFFFLAILSESGYLVRSAFLLDRVMHMFGLHGKAFIPLVMGFGCNVPAVLATRTIESPRSRLIAILINPYIACTARLPVFILFAGAFFADWAGTVVFGMYMLSAAIALGAGVFLGKFVIHGENEPFVMELPPYRLPPLRSVMFHMWEKAYDFLKKVAGVILVGSIVIWFLQEFPRNEAILVPYQTQITALEAQAPGPTRDDALANLKNERNQKALENSYLGRIAMTAAPVFAPLGFGWKDTVAILTGIVAKEVVVASYAVLYAQSETDTEESSSLRRVMSSSMTPVIAFAFMVFVLLYTPCLATLSVIWHETGTWRWPVFSMGFSLVLAWGLAFAITLIGGFVA